MQTQRPRYCGGLRAYRPQTLTPQGRPAYSARRAATGHGRHAWAPQAPFASFLGNRDAPDAFPPGGLGAPTRGNPPAAAPLRARAESPDGAGPNAVPASGPESPPRPFSPSSLSSNTGLRAVAADMDEPILFFHLLHGNRGRGCARASPVSLARGWPAAGGGGAGGASGPAGRARPGGGEPGGAAALLPLRSAPLLMAGPECAPRPEPGT